VKIEKLQNIFRLWTVLLVVVPSLLIMSIYTVAQIAIAKQQNMELMSQRVSSQEQLINYWIGEREDDVRRISQSGELKTLDTQKIKRVLYLMEQGNKNFDSLSYVDKNGVLSISTSSRVDKYSSEMFQPYFRAAREGKEYISEIIIQEETDQPIINFSSPVFDFNGDFQGVILGIVKTTTLEQLLHGNWIGQTGEVLLVNRDGWMLTEPRDLHVLISQNFVVDTAVMKVKIADDVLDQVREKRTGNVTWKNLMGNKVLGAYLYIPARGWTLIGRINENEVLAPIYNQLIMMGAGTLVIVLLILPFAALITNKIKRPLDWLITQSNLVMTGHYKMDRQDTFLGENIPHELATLCETFITMSHKIDNTVGLLKENETKLEHKVNERTIALVDMNMVLAQEIAKHQEANNALRVSRDALGISEKRYKDLFEYMHNGCSYYKVLFDEDQNPVDLEYISVNYTYEKYVGKTAAQIIGKTLTEIAPYIKEERFNWMETYIKVAMHGEPVRFTQYLEHRKSWYSASVYSPAPNYVATTLEDITKYVLLQKEVERMDKLNLIGNMAAGLAHEIRNPMTVVKGYLQYFKKKMPTNLHEQFDLVLSELGRIENIITDFLSIAKNKPTEPKKQDLNEIIHSISPLLSTDALKRGMNIEFKLSTDIPMLILSEKEIKQLLLNLSMNGLNAMEQHGTLTIRTQCTDDHVMLIIDDCGSGISKEVQRQIFDPFFTTRDDGTGLGLSVCASIVESHNGTIVVSSEEGNGTCFTITFPIVREEF